MCDQFATFVMVTNCHKFEFVTEFVSLSFFLSWDPLFFVVFFSKTGLVTFWSKCHKWSHFQLWLVQTCLCFCFLGNASEWNEIQKKRTRKWPLFLFYVWNLDQNGSNRLILKVGLTNSYEHTFYQDCVLWELKAQYTVRVSKLLLTNCVQAHDNSLEVLPHIILYLSTRRPQTISFFLPLAFFGLRPKPITGLLLRRMVNTRLTT